MFSRYLFDSGDNLLAVIIFVLICLFVYDADIAHVYSKFFGPLPSSLMEFALSVHENFPNIVDTKHLLNSSHVLQYLMKKSSKSLSSAFSLLCPKVSSYSVKSAHASYVKFEVEEDEAG